MLSMIKVVQTFPSVRIPSSSGGLPVEVSLIAQLVHGSGNHLFASVSARQQQHQEFVDELDEPSAKLGGTDFDKGDPTSLYSFVVGPKGHPFHRHAGHRIFTAISGSGGAQLRFSSASTAQIDEDPQSFLRALQCINIPPDCMFTVRFGGETWHQFAPLTRNSPHPVFFALSCHTNELGGDLPEHLRQQVLANEASIPSLTSLLPQEVADLLDAAMAKGQVTTVDLSLEAPPGTLQRAMCYTARGTIGTILGKWGAWRRSKGFVSHHGDGTGVRELDATPDGSLLLKQFEGTPFHHEDTFTLTMPLSNFQETNATALLSRLLDGFMENPPRGVTRMMAVRNVLVRPMGLRTSSLGCPVSSLLSPDKSRLFAHRFPVLEQSTDEHNTRAQVVLGADDKHLSFRSCVAARIVKGGQVEFSLGSRVRCKNLFGRFYMWAIDRTHRAYVTPTMLRMAVAHATIKAPADALGSAAVLGG
ncbi:DUF2867 domain-containing protein [Massilia scottii]|uniref:DUF2867 domain-containing protein n=1 Tax=Massilia scottii TaxID=3057166 RepID=UPI002796496D|nr:DUF2867 domain-containing protein [Massilia sp. CCM 9029]MDQ1835165.1 DUF2867 domain-containing protein [Massilia sp. CCM 9029]